MIPEHYKDREQTFVKHTVLKRYLKRLFMIKGQFEPVICYIDCFAGPWQTDRENMNDTSIAISLSIMDECRAALAKMNKNIKFRALYIEKDPKAYERLVDFLKNKQLPNIQTFALNGDFFSMRNTICEWCDDDSFAFFFIDPTGWKDVVELNTLQPLLARRKSEYLVNFMFDFILRSHTQDSYEQHMCDIFGTVPDTKNMTPGEREDCLIRLYRNGLKNASVRCEKGPRTAHVRILYPNKDRTFFHLVYLTRHPMGIYAFMEESERVEIIQNMVRARTSQEKRIEKTKQNELFDDSECILNDNRVALHQVKDYWLARLSFTPKRYGVNEIADMLEETDWFIRDFQAAFKELQNEGKVKNLDSTRNRPKNVVHFKENDNEGEQLVRVEP